jgi:hypothetical protein
MANIAAKMARRLAQKQRLSEIRARNLIMREKRRQENIAKREKKEKRAWERATLQARYQRAKAGLTNVTDYLTPRVRIPRVSTI